MSFPFRFKINISPFYVVVGLTEEKGKAKCCYLCFVDRESMDGTYKKSW